MSSHRYNPRLKGVRLQYLQVVRKENLRRGYGHTGLGDKIDKDIRYPSQRLIPVVSIISRFSIDDSPYTTEFILEEGTAGNSEEAAMVVFDGIENAKVQYIAVKPHSLVVAWYMEARKTQIVNMWRIQRYS